MSEPEIWKQEGPLGDGVWVVSVDGGKWVDVQAGCERHTATIPNAKYAQHLRDFARALDRAADALEGAAGHAANGAEHCMWCGKTLAEHDLIRGAAAPAPRMPCGGLKSGFRVRPADAPPVAKEDC